MLENIGILNLSQRKKTRIYLVSEPNYHITKFFTEKLLAIGMKKNRDTYELTCLFLGLLILELSKILTYKFKWNYVKPKYDEKVKLCYMDKDSYII